MLLSYEHRFVFIANPKTASVSLEAALRPYGKGYPQPLDASEAQLKLWEERKKTARHLGLKTIKQIYGEEVARRFTWFAVKRDPVDWLLSFYFFRQREKIASPQHPSHKNFIGETSLDGYLEGIEKRSLQRPRSQLTRLSDPAGEVSPTLLRFEHLQEDLAALCEELGIPAVDLPHRNPSTKRDGFTADQLTEEQYRRILTLYAGDVVALGYGARHPLAAEILAVSKARSAGPRRARDGREPGRRPRVDAQGVAAGC